MMRGMMLLTAALMLTACGGTMATEADDPSYSPGGLHATPVIVTGAEGWYDITVNGHPLHTEVGLMIAKIRNGSNTFAAHTAEGELRSGTFPSGPGSIPIVPVETLNSPAALMRNVI